METFLIRALQLILSLSLLKYNALENKSVTSILVAH